MSPAEIFAAHAGNCARCKTVVLERPATLANACLEGSQLFKDAAAAARRELRAAPRRRTTAEEQLEADVARHCGRSS